MEQSNQKQVLSSSTAASRSGIFRRIISHTPRWVIALLLIVLFQAVEFAISKLDLSYPIVECIDDALPFLMIAAIFTAGAIQRLNWRHALFLILLLVVGKVLGFLCAYMGFLPSEGYHPYSWMLKTTILLWLLGIGEALTTGKRSLRIIVWMLIVAVSIEAIRQIVRVMIGSVNIFL